MSLKVKILPIMFTLSDWWCSKEDFESMTPKDFREMVEEDLLSFLEEIPGGLLSQVGFSWEDDDKADSK